MYKNSNRHREYQSPTIEEAFKTFITDDDHPCIMAKAATQFDRVTIHQYEKFGSKEAAKKILSDLDTYIQSYNPQNNDFESMLAVFPGEPNFSEKEFEKKLWKQLSLIHHLDSKTWDNQVSQDPTDPNFSFSVLGKAFYVVGLHPNSSRNARRFKYSAIAFNLHQQFEQLRELGSYHQVRDTIRHRDKQQNGSINPMLQDFGVHSEARQYSGRAVNENWECPFKHDLNKKT